MRMTLTLLVFMFGNAIALAQQAAPADLMEAEQKWNECIRIRDVKCAELYLAPDYALAVAEPGKPLGQAPRAQWLAVLPDYRISEMRVGEKLVRIYDDTAVVIYPYYQQAKVRGLDVTGDFLITDVWVKRSNKWLVSLRLSSRFFATAPAAKP